MSKKVKAIPEGCTSVTPYLMVSDARAAIEYYKQAFGATEIMRFEGHDGKICHAEIKIGNSMVMLADAMPVMNFHDPKHFGGSPAFIMLYVEDVDTTFNKAVATGAVSVRPIQDQFYGDRTGSLCDPFGHTWCIATHVEELTSEEVHERFAAMKA